MTASRLRCGVDVKLKARVGEALCSPRRGRYTASSAQDSRDKVCSISSSRLRIVWVYISASFHRLVRGSRWKLNLRKVEGTGLGASMMPRLPPLSLPRYRYQHHASRHNIRTTIWLQPCSRSSLKQRLHIDFLGGSASMLSFADIYAHNGGPS